MVPDRIGWYRQAKSGTHHGETPGLCVHKIAMEVGSDATPEDLMKALGDGDEQVRMAAASNRNATPEVLMKALGDGAEDVREAAARHPNATPAVLMKALENQDIKVLDRAASHQNATPEVLMKALEDYQNPSVGCAAAYNPKATTEVLMKALENKIPNVRWTAASNRNATLEVLMKAVGDDSHYVREAALYNPNATARIGAEGLINVLKSRIDSGIPTFLRDFEVHTLQFPLSDLVRLVITDGRVDLDDLDLFQKGLEESQFAQYAPLFRRMIGLEKNKRKIDA